MMNPLLSPDSVEQTDVLAGKLTESIQAFQRDLQTGLVEVCIPGMTGQILLFVRGELVSVYRGDDSVERIDPAIWLESINGSNPASSLRRLALTPQDVRIFKILIEQKSDDRCIFTDGPALEKQFSEWMELPTPALAQVRWPKAEALVMFPGRGVPPYYTLFISANQILHSAGGMSEIYGWKETYDSLRLFSSEPRTLAWSEFLLYHAFSSLVSSLLKKVEKLIGRLMLNQLIRDVNFKATAHDWNLSINANSVNDQSIFTSPAAAAEVYSRLLEVIFHSLESLLGGAMLEMLVREAVNRLSPAARQVVKEYLPVTNLGA
jgi:hypothetical protein